GQRKNIKAFLDKMSTERQLHFIMAGEPGEWNERTTPAYTVMLQIQVDTAADGVNEIISNAHDPNTLQLVVRSSAALCDDPEFLKQVVDTIIQIASR
ncbi:MAG: hypothetical protein Q8918_19410, partial [Bacteroidota bacterium]|nr:hypothetical protein [Bacteroidota bacterium]